MACEAVNNDQMRAKRNKRQEITSMHLSKTNHMKLQLNPSFNKVSLLNNNNNKVSRDLG